MPPSKHICLFMTELSLTFAYTWLVQCAEIKVSVLLGRWGGGGLQAVLSQAGTLNVANLFTDLIRWIEPSQI